VLPETLTVMLVGLEATPLITLTTPLDELNFHASPAPGEPLMLLKLGRYDVGDQRKDFVMLPTCVLCSHTGVHHLSRPFTGEKSDKSGIMATEF